MRILSLDVGDVRIGVAVSDPTGTIATPVTTVRRTSRERVHQAIADLVREHEAELVVIGLPRTLSGEIGPQAQRVIRFGDGLASVLQVPVEYWNETFSTLDAEEILSSQGSGRKLGRGERGRLDEVAAAVILQNYLRSGRGRTSQP